MMPSSTIARATRPILWVAALAMLLVTMTSKVELRACLGGCAATASSTLCCVEPEAPSECCGCCDSPAEAPTPAEDDDDSDCCVTIDFDIEQGPSPTAPKFSVPEPVICWIAPLHERAQREYAPARPFYFDRGPPQVDQRTVLRATQVLRI